MFDPTFTGEGREALVRLVAWRATNCKQGYDRLAERLLDSYKASVDATDAAARPGADDWPGFVDNLARDLRFALDIVVIPESWRNQTALSVGPGMEQAKLFVHWLLGELKQGVVAVADLKLTMLQVAYHDSLAGHHSKGSTND